jgi:hypothetical protein
MKIRRTYLPNKVLLLFLLVSFFTGIVSLASVMLDIAILKLWKEGFMVLMLVVALFYSGGRLSSKSIIPTIILFLILIFALFTIASDFNSKSFIIFYQLKFDILPLVFLIALLISLSKQSLSELETLCKSIAKMMFFLGGMNAIAIILQQLFPDSFMGLLGLKTGEWGNETGVRLNSTEGNIRAIGFQLAFTMSGVLMFFCFVVSIEFRKFFGGKRWPLFFSPLFLVAIVCTTYKTAILAAMVYITTKVIEFLFKKYSNIIVFFMGLSIFSIFCYSTHSLDVYEMVRPYNENSAYNSIYLRVVQHWKILGDLDSTAKILFGAGLGLNGTFGLDKAAFGIQATPTDSAYIYMVSNYGFVGFFTYLALMVYLQIKLYKIKQFDIFGARYFVFFTLTIELFYNLGLANFPNNILLILFVAIPFVLHRKSLESHQDIRLPPGNRMY